MRVLGPPLGLALVAVALLDLAWTTVAAGSGAGPVTSRLAGATWHAALAVHRRRPSHRLLAAAGVGIVLVILAAWILGVLIGWSLVFASSEGAVRSSATGQAAGTGQRLYFTGYTVFTLGNGDFRPGEGAWQLATVAAAGTGLVLVTLAITYLVPVASAVAQRRQLASYVSALGDDAADILGRAWNGVGFGSLTQHLVALAPLVDAARQRHLTYPVLHYYHSVDHTSAAARSLVNLAVVVDALAYGVTPQVRPDAAALGPVDRAIDSFLDTLAAAYISRADEAHPPLALDRLRERGIPTVDHEKYVAATTATRARRHLLAGLLLDDGWELPTTVKEKSSVSDRRCTRDFQTRWLAPLTVLLAALAVAGCGGDEELSDGGSPQSEAQPLVGTYVGTVSDSDAYIALNSDGTRVGGYVSDGGQVSIWLGAGDIDDGRAQLVARRDGARLGEVILGPQSTSGTVEIAGVEHSFSAAPATGEAGLYRSLEGAPGAPGFEETGWIVLSDGSEKGSTNITDETGSTRTQPAPKRTTEAKVTDPTTDI